MRWLLGSIICNDIILTPQVTPEPPNCQGTVIRIMREERTNVAVQIKWDKECLRKGDRKISQDLLMRSMWNSNEHEQ